MIPENENRERDQRPLNEKIIPEKKKNEIDEDEDESSAPRIDIEKETFVERPHGRTKTPMGPGHEPGTLG